MTNQFDCMLFFYLTRFQPKFVVRLYKPATFSYWPAKIHTAKLFSRKWRTCDCVERIKCSVSPRGQLISGSRAVIAVQTSWSCVSDSNHGHLYNSILLYKCPCSKMEFDTVAARRGCKSPYVAPQLQQLTGVSGSRVGPALPWESSRIVGYNFAGHTPDKTTAAWLADATGQVDSRLVDNMKDPHRYSTSER